MTTQPALPGMEADAALMARAIVEYRTLYGADDDSARIGVEVMADRFGTVAAVIAELRRLAGQVGDPVTEDIQRQDRAA